MNQVMTTGKGAERPGSPLVSRRGRLFATLAVSLALVLAVAGTTPERGHAVPQAEKSVSQTVRKGVWGPPTTLNGPSLFPTYRHLGIGVFIIQARWDAIAPAARPLDPKNPGDPAYHWPTYLDEAVAEAQAYGMRVQILLMGTPRWANGGRSWRWVPRDPRDFANFAAAIERRYPSVNLWMIWGEPNRANNFAPFTNAKPKGKLNRKQQRAPRNYARMLDAAYGALKAESRANLVIGGNTFTAAGKKRGPIRTFQWLSHMKLPGGKRPRMDMWGHNPWGFKKPSLKGKPSPYGTVTFNDLRRLVRRLDKVFRGRRLKLYLAEWGVPTGFKDQDLGYKLSPKAGRQWINAGFRIARWKRVYSLGWIHLVDKERNSTGVLDRRGNPKPIYKAYRLAR